MTEPRKKDVTNEIIMEEAETDRSQIEETSTTPRLPGKIGRSNILSQIAGGISSLRKKADERGVKKEGNAKLERESKEIMAKVKLKQSKHKDAQQQHFSNNLKNKAAQI